MGLHHLPAAIRRPPPQRPLVDIVRDTVHGNPNAVPALCKVLREQIGNPDLETAVDAILSIYDAEPQAHYEAAHRLGKAAQDACDDYLIEMD